MRGAVCEAIEAIEAFWIASPYVTRDNRCGWLQGC